MGSIKDIKTGDKIAIEGLNVSPTGKMYFGKKKKTGRKKPDHILIAN